MRAHQPQDGCPDRRAAQLEERDECDEHAAHPLHDGLVDVLTGELTERRGDKGGGDHE